MAQTNVQVPIQQRNHDKEVLEKRKVLFGAERYKAPPPGGPSSLGQDDKDQALVVYHGTKRESPEALDMLYLEHTTDAGQSVAGMPTLGRHKQHMSGRVDHGRNQGRNVGSEHMQMPPEPHMASHRKAGKPLEGSISLPKDQ
jgi:hypothetical protein